MLSRTYLQDRGTTPSPWLRGHCQGDSSHPALLSSSLPGQKSASPPPTVSSSFQTDGPRAVAGGRRGVEASPAKPTGGAQSKGGRQGGGTSERPRARFSQLWYLATSFVNPAQPPRGGERRGEKDFGWMEPEKKESGKGGWEGQLAVRTVFWRGSGSLPGPPEAQPPDQWSRGAGRGIQRSGREGGGARAGVTESGRSLRPLSE